MGIEGYVSPLEGVKVIACTSPPEVESPAYTGENFQVNQNEYRIFAEGVGYFYARNSREVVCSVFPDADEGWVKLYLNGQVLVALLHQRKIISFHASSFVHDGRGVMMLGETGAGKTSLTVAFASAGAAFMSDDLTPVIFSEAVPHIWSLDRKIKLRADSIDQLNISHSSLTDAEAGTGKKYLRLDKGEEEYNKLDIILKIETGAVDRPVFTELTPAEKFALLRSEICSWEILAGMPETEAVYLQQLVRIIDRVHFVKVTRPATIRIPEMYVSIREYLEGLA